MPHNPQNMQTDPVTDGTQKALPKAVVEAIDAYASAIAWGSDDESSRPQARIALETEIERHCVDRIAAELNRLRSVLFLDDPRVRDYVVERLAKLRGGDHVADAGKMVPVDAPTEAEIEAWKKEIGDYMTPHACAKTVALMRRAAAAKKLLECQFGDIGSSKHARYEVYTTPVLGWSVGEPLPNLSVEVDGKVTRYVPEKQGGQ